MSANRHIVTSKGDVYRPRGSPVISVYAFSDEYSILIP